MNGTTSVLKTDDRRRNARAENCRSCGKPCEAGHGYLYRDTNGRPNRYTGRFGWFVKCDECHVGAKSRMVVAMGRSAASRRVQPAVRPWSVAQVKAWTVSLGNHQGDVAMILGAKTFSQVVSHRTRIEGYFAAPTGYALEELEVCGRPLSPAAVTILEPQILRLERDVQDAEDAAEKAATALLEAAGAIVTRRACGSQIAFGGGNYLICGHMDGTNRVSGHAQGDGQICWVETTAEGLIAASKMGIQKAADVLRDISEPADDRLDADDIAALAAWGQPLDNGPEWAFTDEMLDGVDEDRAIDLDAEMAAWQAACEAGFVG